MGSELSQSSQAKSVTPGAVYKQLSKGDQILPEQFAAMRNWSVPNLLALVVMLQADLVGSSKIERVVGQPFTNLPRTQWSIESGTRRRRRSRRIVRERWLGLLVAVVLLIAMPLLGATEAGRAVVQVSVPFLIGAASLWLFSQGRWLAESRNDTKVQAGRAAVTMSAIGSLIAVVWILTEIAGIGLSIGVDIVRYATAL